MLVNMATNAFKQENNIYMQFSIKFEMLFWQKEWKGENV